jgi:NitT/TauT family transport system substrate-binding protein
MHTQPFGQEVSEMSRRGVIGAAATLGFACLIGAGRALAAPAKELKPVRFAWNANSACNVGVPTAKEKGFFAAHGLDVELVNYSGSTDQLLETLATGKADAALGMALRWLKPLEQGFDVKIVSGVHGGCMRLVVPVSGGIRDLSDLKGNAIAVSDMNSPAKHFFSILLKKAGIDPYKDVDFKVYPGPLLRAAVEKGEAQAAADNDPNTYLWLKDGTFSELASNLSGEYAHRACCIIGVGGKLVREDKATARAITQAIIDAQDFAAANPAEAAATLAPYATKVTLDDLTQLVRYHTHHHHPTGTALKQELATYAEELKLVSVLKPSFDTAKYADRIYADVLS